MIAYIHDGTFEGFLSSIYEAYYNSIKPEEIISKYDFNHELYYEPIFINTDENNAKKVHDSIIHKLGEDTLYNAYYCSLCSDRGSNTLAYKYIRLGFKIGKDINLHLHNDIVLSVIKMARKVNLESHRMLGFVRFKYINNELLYSSIEPDNNILELISPHFQKRLSGEKWIIQDVKRNIAALYDSRELIFAELSLSNSYYHGDFLDEYEKLWIEYFKSAVIEERVNPSLQKRSMPKRYWKHILEMTKSYE